MKEIILTKIRKESGDLSVTSICEAFDKNRSSIKYGETNGIYFHDTSLDEELARECNLYFDLENSAARWIDLKDCDEFERSHIIITGPEFSLGTIQKEFIVEAARTTQEDATKIIIKKYGRKTL